MSYNFTEKQKNRIIKNWGENIYSRILQNIEIYSDKWKLSDFEFVEYYSVNAIFFCKSELYGDCVLKIGGNEQNAEFIGEYNTLREYNGKRYIKVFEGDIDIEKRKKVMLLERCIPGKMLSEEKSFEKRLAVFSNLFTGLHIEPKNPGIYYSYTDLVCEAAEDCSNSRQDLKGLDAHMQNAKEIYLEVCKKYDKKMLLHIDIYGNNIVSDGEEYRIIDPKGVLGDPIFDTGQFLFNECCENSIQAESAEIMFGYLEKSINIPQKILKQCFYIETVRFICYYASRYGAKQWDVDRINFAESVMNGDK